MSRGMDRAQPGGRSSGASLLARVGGGVKGEPSVVALSLFLRSPQQAAGPKAAAGCTQSTRGESQQRPPPERDLQRHPRRGLNPWPRLPASRPLPSPSTTRSAGFQLRSIQLAVARVLSVPSLWEDSDYVPPARLPSKNASISSASSAGVCPLAGICDRPAASSAIFSLRNSRRRSSSATSPLSQ